MTSYDYIFLGSSPNALVAASRLARAGKRVLVLEPRKALGGPVTTEEFAPGFFADTGVMSAAIDPAIAADLGISIELHRRDRITLIAPGTGGASLLASTKLPAAITNAVELLRAVYRTAAPAMPAFGADADALHALGARLLALGPREMHEVLRLLSMSARDYFDEQEGQDDGVKACLCGAALRGVSEGPFAPGTLFNFLHHEATFNGLFPSTANGGLRSLTEALAQNARSHGAEILHSVGGPIKVITDDGVALGVSIGGGERIESGAIVSDFDARITLTQFIPPYELSPEANRAVKKVRYKGSVARVHIALRGLPDFYDLRSREEALAGTMVLSPNVESLEQAWDQAKRGSLPSNPYMEITVPTVSDPSLSPGGMHVLSVWVQNVPYTTTNEAALVKTVISALSEVSRDFPNQVLHVHSALPKALEKHFHLTEGHLYGGEISLAQAFYLRPIPGYDHYRSPITNLYLAGSAAHPGGYSGLSGWNFAGLELAKTAGA